MTKALLLAAALIAPALVAAPAAAQVNGVAVADLRGAVGNTRAWATARTQIQSTYKAQLDQADARSKAIENELRPLAAQFEAARRAPNANQQALQTQLQSIQSKQQAGQAEIGRITAPAQRAQAYVVEQIETRLGEAVQNVVKQRNVSLLVNPQAVLFLQPTADITPAVTAELDRLVPSVNANVPANWQPGQAQAAGATPTGAAPAAGTPARPPVRSGGR